MFVVDLDDTARTRTRGAIVTNPGSGRARATTELEEIVRDVADLRVYEVTADDPPEACARRALAEGARYLLAAGGDGTVSGVAAALVGTDVPLGILPCGTANSIARALGLPGDADGALRVLSQALHGELEPRRIDTAVANGRTMVLLASVGLHATAVAEAPSEAKKQWGSLAYVLTGMRKLREQQPFLLRLFLEDERIECRATNITVANLAPRQTVSAQGPSVVAPDDGWLDATIVAADTVPSALAAGWHLLRSTWSGEPARRDDIGYVVTRRIVIETEPPQPVLVDGEVAGTSPLEVVSRPSSLLVFAPPAATVDKPLERKLDGLPGLKIEPSQP